MKTEAALGVDLVGFRADLAIRRAHQRAETLEALPGSVGKGDRATVVSKALEGQAKLLGGLEATCGLSLHGRARIARSSSGTSPSAAWTSPKRIE